MKTAHGIVRFRGEYVYLDPAEIERLRLQLEKPPRTTQAELLRMALTEEYLGSPVMLDVQARDMIRELTGIGSVPLPVRSMQSSAALSGASLCLAISQYPYRVR